MYSLKTNSSVQLGYEQAYELSWAPPPHHPSVDVRAIVRQVLGPGEPAALPLTIDLRWAIASELMALTSRLRATSARRT